MCGNSIKPPTRSSCSHQHQLGRVTDITSGQALSEWTSLIARIENALRLQHHHEGPLAGLSDYLHLRTAGMIGSLSHLIRGAALDAILTGTGKITKKQLDAVDVDHAAQTHARRPCSTRES